MIQLRSVFVVAAALSAAAFSQEPPPIPPPPPPPGADVMFYTARGGAGGALINGPEVAFVQAEFGMEGKVVKGAPYSAQAVTEFTQTLADGNRISRTTNSFVARDSEGRTRREQSMGAIGPFAASGEAPKIVTIHDPVAGTSYMLDAKTKTANLMHDPPRPSAEEIAKAGGHGPAVSVSTLGGAELGERVHIEARQMIQIQAAGKDVSAKQESLGSQMINGVLADGNRITRTIPAGQVGNDRPIEITRETWYSQELQTIVMSKSSDPRAGDTVYKLTNIDRTLPAPSLFAVPADYTVNEGKALWLSGQPSPQVKQ